jgi:hypothetical protein
MRLLVAARALGGDGAVGSDQERGEEVKADGRV